MKFRIQQLTRDNQCIVVAAVGLAALGLWHHLYFSYTVGEFSFFKNAYDEDTFALLPFGQGQIRVDRLLSGTVVSSLMWISGGSCDFTLAALDALFPPLMIVAAYYAGAAIFSRFPARILFALVLVFSFDLFSLGGVIHHPLRALDGFKALVGSSYVPPFEISYLSLYRSPEPQVSYVVAFLFVGLLLRVMFRNDNSMSRLETVWLIALQALLTTCYALISYPLFFAEGLAATALLLAGQRRNAIVFGVLSFASVLAALVFARITLGPSTNIVFSSRLPVITIGVILALTLTLTFVFLILQSGRLDGRLASGLAFAAMPLALTNQQLVTGIMASAREWERYADLPFCVIAAAILVSYTGWEIRWRRLMPLATIMIVLFVAGCSIATFLIWLPDNLKSLAIARALKSAGAMLDDDVLLVLNQPEHMPSVEARMGRRLHGLLNYTDAFIHIIPSTPDFRPTSLANNLFEFWKQMGVTPDVAKHIIEHEVNQRSGFYSGFLFNICDYSFPCTDGRNVKTENLAAAIPSVIQSYTAFLAKPAPLVKVAFVDSTSSRLSKGRKIGEGHAGSVTALVWLRD